MRPTQTILEMVHQRGEKGLPLEKVYRLLYTPENMMAQKWNKDFLESRMTSKESGPVWGGAVGKVPVGNSPAAYSTTTARFYNLPLTC